LFVIGVEGISAAVGFLLCKQTGIKVLMEKMLMVMVVEFVERE